MCLFHKDTGDILYIGVLSDVFRLEFSDVYVPHQRKQKLMGNYYIYTV